MNNSNLAMAGRTGRIASRNGSRGDSVGNRAGSGTRGTGGNTTPGGGGMIRSGSNSRPQTAAPAGGSSNGGAGGQKDLRNALEEIT